METMRLRDGRRLAYEVRGTGPTALFIHAFPLDHEMWHAQLHDLADIRRCVAVDLHGFGRSSHHVPERLTMEGHASDMAELLAHIDSDQADIVGLSMGGYVAMALAESNPELFRTIVLCDTKSEADTEEGKEGRNATAAGLVSEGRAAFARKMLGVLVAEDAPVAIKARLLTTIEKTPYETIAAALYGMRDRPDRTELLAGLSVPALVVVGEGDQLAPPAVARNMAEAMEDARLVVVPQAGHLAAMENPGLVNTALRDLWEA